MVGAGDVEHLAALHPDTPAGEDVVDLHAEPAWEIGRVGAGRPGADGLQRVHAALGRGPKGAVVGGGGCMYAVLSTEWKKDWQI